MFWNLKKLLCRNDKIVGFECDILSVDGSSLVVDEHDHKFLSGLDIEIYIERMCLNNPNKRNNITIVQEPELEFKANVHYYMPQRAIYIEPPVKVSDGLTITLRENHKEFRLFFNNGSTIFRNVIEHIAVDTPIKILKQMDAKPAGPAKR